VASPGPVVELLVIARVSRASGVSLPFDSLTHIDALPTLHAN
jgi:hypothetical protein